MSTHAYRDPDAYSRNNKLQYSFAMQVLEKANISSEDRVLDLGCGDGRITAHIASIANNGCVVGTDISEEMIQYASKAYESQHNLRFLQMDTCRNVFKNQFDVVVSFNSLHWIKDQEKALRGIAAAVTVKGRIVLLLSNKKSCYHHALDNVCTSLKWAGHFKNYSNPRSFFTKGDYQALLNGVGIEVCALE